MASIEADANSTITPAEAAQPGHDENLPNSTVIVALKQLLQERFPKQQITYNLSKATTKGDNYLGVVYRIAVDIEENANEKFSLILKVPPQNSIRRKQFFARPCFLREIVAYEQFLPLVERFQREKSVPESDCFCHYAVCYRCLDTELDEAIFLEDLCATGFRLHDRFTKLQCEHVVIVMRAYAKLHAVSLALKQQQPERLAPFKQMVDIFEQRRTDVALGSYFEQLKTNALGALDSAGDTIYIERLKRYFARGTSFELLLELIASDNCEPYAVVSHGDCWNNNILYRYEQNVAVDARLIDWQIMRYASPVIDLAYYIYTCTTKEFRDQYYDEMIDYYYNELDAQLKRLGTNAQVAFPRDAFNEQLKDKSAAGLLLAMMVLPIITISGEEVPDLEALSEAIEAGGTTDLQGSGFLSSNNEKEYNRRMREVIIDVVDRNYI